MQPAPLTSGGLALEEVTCRGWGPHLQYSFKMRRLIVRTVVQGTDGKYDWTGVGIGG